MNTEPKKNREQKFSFGAAAFIFLFISTLSFLFFCDTSALEEYFKPPAESRIKTHGPVLEKKRLVIKNNPILVEIADTKETRKTGLMHREHMPEDQGMLFVFDTPDILSFWMKNTIIPLSIAFISADGVILNIEDMQPHTLDSHTSAEKALYALEMNQGWFSEKAVTPGDKIPGLHLLKGGKK